MSTLNAIKGIRDDLSRDIAAAQKAQGQLADQLRTLAANLKATEATVAAKVRFLASLDAIQREADQALAGTAPVRQGRKPGPSRKNRAKVAGKAKAVKAAAKAPTIKPDEVKVRRKPGPKSKAEKAAARAAAKAEKAAIRLKKKAERESAKAAAKAAGVKLTKDGRPAKKPGPKPGTPRVTKASGAKVTKVKAGHPGKRANGVRPSTKDAIFQVLNGQSLTADDIFKALKAKGWLPNSNDPRNYIAYLLSSTKDRFERVKGAGRGVYRCKTGAAASVAAPVAATVVEAPKAAPVVEAPKAEVVATDGTLRMSADDILTNAGVLGEASFGG